MDATITTLLNYHILGTHFKLIQNHLISLIMMRFGLMNIWSEKQITIQWFVGLKEDMMMDFNLGLMIWETSQKENIKAINSQMILESFYLTTQKLKLQSQRCGKWLHWNLCLSAFLIFPTVHRKSTTIMCTQQKTTLWGRHYLI